MALFNNFPYSNTEEINLDYTLNKLNELYSRGENLYAELQAWKTETDEANEAWKSDLLSDINEWQNSVTHSLEEWKTSVDSEVSNALTTLSNQITAELAQAKADLRQEVANLASAAAASAADAAASQSAAAQSAQSAINSAATAAQSEQNITESAEQIETNKNDITDLKSALETVNNEIYGDIVTRFNPELTIIPNSQVASGTGAISESTSQSRSDYTDLKNCESFELSEIRYTNYVLFDADKNYISGSTTVTGVITRPPNAKYVMFTASNTLVARAKLTLYNLNTFATYVKDRIKWALFGKSINWCGDSIVDGEDFDEKVCSALHLYKMTTDGVDGGINGSTIALNGDGSNTRNAICLRYVNMPNNADIIVVSAGTNDWMYAWSPIGDIDSTDNKTFYGALKNLCNGLITKYPNKIIFFTTPIKRAQAFENGNGGEYTADGVNTTPFSKNKYGKTLKDYADIIKEVCTYYSIPVLDMYSESLLNPHISAQQNLFDTALTHPNTNGQKIMARRVAGYMIGLGYKIE